MIQIKHCGRWFARNRMSQQISLTRVLRKDMVPVWMQPILSTDFVVLAKFIPCCGTFGQQRLLLRYCLPTSSSIMVSGREESDLDSTSSSFTALDSRRSCISDISFSSSVSVCSVGGEAAATYKPHKVNQAEWEAIRRVHASAGRVGLDHFRLVRRLGSGDLGSVYLCKLRDPRAAGCLYAMKVVDKEALAFKKKLQRAETEREILRSLDHPFLPTLYAEFDASHYSCFVMEFCPGGDLHVARQRRPGRRFSISAAKFYAAETVLALEYLHIMGVVYRDLKPENILVRDDGHIMLSDFDLSLKCDVIPKLVRPRLTKTSSSVSSCTPPMQPVLSCFTGGTFNCTKKERKKEEDDEEEELDPELLAEPMVRSKSFVGTHEYLAPEVLSGAGHGSAVDWWALGIFLYEMIYGRTPFKGEGNDKTLVNIIKQQLIFPRVEASGREAEEELRAQDLIGKLLTRNPRRRIGGVGGSGEIKRHEFFKGVNWALIRSVRPPEVPRDLRRVKSEMQPAVKTLSRKERDEPFQISRRFDYF